MTGRNISTQFVIFVCSENFDVWQRVDISFDELGIVEQRRREKKEAICSNISNASRYT